MKRHFDWLTFEAQFKGHVTLLAFGKAAPHMAQAALDLIPPQRIARPALVVTTEDNIPSIQRADMEIYAAGHPWPDMRGANAANILMQRAKAAQADDLVLVLVSGGGSALIPAPTVPLTDKIAITDKLLASGAPIEDINCVRKHLSHLKGGGLVTLASPARLEAFVISDVVGDDLSTIASGPTVPDPTTFADAANIIEKYELQPPVSIAQRLASGLKGQAPETPKSGHSIFARTATQLIATNQHIIDAIATQAQEDGHTIERAKAPIVGEARLAAKALAERLLPRHDKARSWTAHVSGGETTVTLKNIPSGQSPGYGGRNQEFALAFALAAEALDIQRPWTLLSAGTDGRDGPTHAAGGCVDSGTLARIRASGLNPEDSLTAHDSGTALKSAGDLFCIGGTGTNVADIQILVIGK